MHDLAVVGISRIVLRVAHGLLELAGWRAKHRAGHDGARPLPADDPPAGQPVAPVCARDVRVDEGYAA